MFYCGSLGSEHQVPLQWVSRNFLSTCMSSFSLSFCVLFVAAAVETAQLRGAYFWGNIFRENCVLKFTVPFGVCPQVCKTFQREKTVGLWKHSPYRAAWLCSLGGVPQNGANHGDWLVLFPVQVPQRDGDLLLRDRMRCWPFVELLWEVSRVWR